MTPSKTIRGVIYAIIGGLAPLIPMVQAHNDWEYVRGPACLIALVLGVLNAVASYMDTTIRPIRKDDRKPQ